MSRNTNSNRRLRYVNYDDLYNKYRQQYRKSERHLARYGREMHSQMMSRNDFKHDVKSMRMKGYAPQKAVNKLVSQQKFEFSSATAKTWMDAFKKYDVYDYKPEWKDLSAWEIRSGGVDLSTLNNILKQYKDSEGHTLTGTDRALIIGEAFFGIDPVTGKSR